MSDARNNRINVRLSDHEVARLDKLKPRGSTRGSFIRSFIRRTPAEAEVASHEEALAILTAQARDGSATAAVALERALREDTSEDHEPDELERILEGRRLGE